MYRVREAVREGSSRLGPRRSPRRLPGLSGAVAAVASVALAMLSACSGGVGIAGTVPPPPGTIQPDPSGLAETPTSAVPTPDVTASPGATPPPGTDRPTPTGVQPTPGATPRQTPRSTPTPAPPTPEPTPPPTPQPTQAGTIVLTNYFLLDSGGGPRLVPVPRTLERVPAIGGATLRALLAGPTSTEADAGITSAIPSGALLLDLTIDNGLATVDLSSEFAAAGSETELQARVAQVLYTLTQFSTVKRVAFELDGQPTAVPTPDAGTTERPVARDDYVALLPFVFVESPRFGESVSSPIRLSGVANVFEAVFQVELLDESGARLARRTFMARCGTGCWGDFRENVAFEIDTEQTGKLIVYTLSAKDGSVEDPRSYDLNLVP